MQPSRDRKACLESSEAKALRGAGAGSGRSSSWDGVGQLVNEGPEGGSVCSGRGGGQAPGSGVSPGHSHSHPGVQPLMAPCSDSSPPRPSSLGLEMVCPRGKFRQGPSAQAMSCVPAGMALAPEI